MAVNCKACVCCDWKVLVPLFFCVLLSPPAITYLSQPAMVIHGALARHVFVVHSPTTTTLHITLKSLQKRRHLSHNQPPIFLAGRHPQPETPMTSVCVSIRIIVIDLRFLNTKCINIYHDVLICRNTKCNKKYHNVIVIAVSIGTYGFHKQVEGDTYCTNIYHDVLNIRHTNSNKKCHNVITVTIGAYEGIFLARKIQFLGVLMQDLSSRCFSL